MNLVLFNATTFYVNRILKHAPGIQSEDHCGTTLEQSWFAGLCWCFHTAVGKTNDKPDDLVKLLDLNQYNRVFTSVLCHVSEYFETYQWTGRIRSHISRWSENSKINNAWPSVTLIACTVQLPHSYSVHYIYIYVYIYTYNVKLLHFIHMSLNWGSQLVASSKDSPPHLHLKRRVWSWHTWSWHVKTDLHKPGN